MVKLHSSSNHNEKCEKFVGKVSKIIIKKVDKFLKKNPDIPKDNPHVEAMTKLRKDSISIVDVIKEKYND